MPYIGLLFNNVVCILLIFVAVVVICDIAGLYAASCEVEFIFFWNDRDDEIFVWVSDSFAMITYRDDYVWLYKNKKLMNNCMFVCLDEN